MNEPDPAVTALISHGLELIAAIIKTLTEVKAGAMTPGEGKAKIDAMWSEVKGDRAAIDKLIEERSKGP